MKRKFFHTPLFVYKNEASARGGTPETQQSPKAPSASDVTNKNEAAAEGLKDAVSVRPAPKANTPRPRLKFNAAGERVPSTPDNTPPTPEKAANAAPVPRNNTPRPRLKFNAAGERVDTPPPTTDTPTSDIPKSPEEPRDPDREYATYHREDGTQETVSRRNGGAWRTTSSDGKRERIILGQNQNIHPETPNQPSKNTVPTPPSTPGQTPPAQSKDKQSPSEGAKVSETAQKTPAAPERKAAKGIGPIENTEELHQPISPENKESPKTATPKKDQKAKTYEEENAVFQTRMNRGDYEGSPAAFKAGLEHAERVDDLRSGIETKKETITPPITEAEKISTSKPEERKTTKTPSESDAPVKKGIPTPSTTEKPKPREAENVPTTDAPPSAEEAKATPTLATEASKNKTPLPADIEQSNEAVITVNGKSIPLTRESPEAAWRDRDGVPYDDALVAGSTKKNPAKTQATKSLHTSESSDKQESSKPAEALKPATTPEKLTQKAHNTDRAEHFKSTPSPTAEVAMDRDLTQDEIETGKFTDSFGMKHSIMPGMTRVQLNGRANDYTVSYSGAPAQPPTTQNTPHQPLTPPVKTEITPPRKAVTPPESVKEDNKKPSESNTPLPMEPVPRDEEEAKYLQKEKDFKKNLDSGKYTQYNTQKGREEFTPEGRKAFRELTSSDHGYIPGAIFSRASDSFFKVPGAAGELHNRGEENSFLKNRAQQRELAQTPSETTIVRAERHKSSKSKNDITNGGENAFNVDMSKGVVSGDDPDLSAERWRTYDYNTMKQGGYPRLTVFSQERDILGKPQFAAKVMHPNDPKTKELEERIAEGGQFPNLYTAEMDVFGNGKPQKVYLLPNELIPNSLSLGDGPASPSKISVLKEKKPEKKEEVKPPKLPEIPYS